MHLMFIPPCVPQIDSTKWLNLLVFLAQKDTLTEWPKMNNFANGIPFRAKANMPVCYTLMTKKG